MEHTTGAEGRQPDSDRDQPGARKGEGGGDEAPVPSGADVVEIAVQGVAETATTTAEGARETDEAAAHLTALAGELRGLVTRFLEGQQSSA